MKPCYKKMLKKRAFDFLKSAGILLVCIVLGFLWSALLALVASFVWLFVEWSSWSAVPFVSLWIFMSVVCHWVIFSWGWSE